MKALTNFIVDDLNLDTISEAATKKAPKQEKWPNNVDAANKKAGQQVGYRVFFGRKGNGLEISYIVETTSHKLYYSDNIA